jgi:hypothetical protein
MMSRRDRAAMQLALGVLRRGALESLRLYPDALAALRLGDAVAGYVWATGRRALSEGVDRDVFNARLALLLRVLLRADAGDYGPKEPWQWCDACGRIEKDPESEAALQRVCTPYPRAPGVVECAPGRFGSRVLAPYPWGAPYRRYAPLWEGGR